MIPSQQKPKASTSKCKFFNSSFQVVCNFVRLQKSVCKINWHWKILYKTFWFYTWYFGYENLEFSNIQSSRSLSLLSPIRIFFCACCTSRSCISQRLDTRQVWTAQVGAAHVAQIISRRSFFWKNSSSFFGKMFDVIAFLFSKMSFSRGWSFCSVLSYDINCLSWIVNDFFVTFRYLNFWISMSSKEYMGNFWGIGVSFRNASGIPQKAIGALMVSIRSEVCFFTKKKTNSRILHIIVYIINPRL